MTDDELCKNEFEKWFLLDEAVSDKHIKWCAWKTAWKIRTIPQPEAANVALDMDNAREVFENWLTADGNYPHLKHKSFGGQYLHEEAAMKWDGFKAGYCALQTPASDGVLEDVIGCANNLAIQINSEGGHGQIVHEMARILQSKCNALKQSTAKDGV